MVGLERAVAVAHQDQHVAVGIAHEQVELAVARQVGDGQPVGFRGHGVRGRRQEAALAVAEVDAQPVRGENGQVVDAVAGEVGHADDRAGRPGLDGGRDWRTGRLPGRRATSIVSDPGLIVTRSVGPPGVSGPPATPAVASRLVTSGVPAGSIADKPVPAR